MQEVLFTVYEVYFSGTSRKKSLRLNGLEGGFNALQGREGSIPVSFQGLRSSALFVSVVAPAECQTAPNSECNCEYKDHQHIYLGF